MLNTTAPLYADNTFEQEMKKQEAELYARLYPMAAEDFTAHPDVKKFATEVVTCFETIQKQISAFIQIVASHTHTVPPHTHPLEPHTHTTTAPGAPTGPNIGGFTTLPTPLSTDVPVQSGSMSWNDAPSPSFTNTTGSVPNMEGNSITVGPSRVGPMITGKRRLKEDPALHKVTVLPIVKDMMKL